MKYFVVKILAVLFLLGSCNTLANAPPEQDFVSVPVETVALEVVTPDTVYITNTIIENVCVREDTCSDTLDGDCGTEETICLPQEHVEALLYDAEQLPNLWAKIEIQDSLLANYIGTIALLDSTVLMLEERIVLKDSLLSDLQNAECPSMNRQFYWAVPVAVLVGMFVK
jgi:hypothetical protein